MWASDAGYKNYRAGKNGWQVLLDGEIVERVFTADTDLGEVVRSKVDADGRLVREGDEFATETLRGTVEVRPL